MNSKQCPQCKGTGIWIDVLESVQDLPCFMCSGLGYVYPDVVCLCGRPAVVATANTFSCGQQICVDKIIGMEPEKPVTNQEVTSQEELYSEWLMGGHGSYN